MSQPTKRQHREIDCNTLFLMCMKMMIAIGPCSVLPGWCQSHRNNMSPMNGWLWALGLMRDVFSIDASMVDRCARRDRNCALTITTTTLAVKTTQSYDTSYKYWLAGSARAIPMMIGARVHAAVVLCNDMAIGACNRAFDPVTVGKLFR